MHSIKHQICSNWLLSCHIAQQFHILCEPANRLSLETCPWEVESRLYCTDINETFLAFLSDGMFKLLCEMASKQTNKNNNDNCQIFVWFSPVEWWNGRKISHRLRATWAIPGVYFEFAFKTCQQHLGQIIHHLAPRTSGFPEFFGASIRVVQDHSHLTGSISELIKHWNQRKSKETQKET